MVGFSMTISTVLNWQYRADQAAAIDTSNAEVAALRRELTCRSEASSMATRIEGEITRIGWRALVTWAETGNAGDPRVTDAATEIRRLYVELGPALEQRSNAAEACDFYNEREGN